MNVIVAQAGRRKSTELIKRFFKEDEPSILISNEYDFSFVKEVCKLHNIDETQMENKVFFHLTEPSAMALVRIIMTYMEQGYKKFFIDDVYGMIYRSPQGIQSILDAEIDHDVEFTLTLQMNVNSDVNATQEYYYKLTRFKDRINIIKL